MDAKTLRETATVIGTVNGVAFYEHPTLGDESPLLITFNGRAVESVFYDLPDAPEFDTKQEIVADERLRRGCG